MVTQVTNFPGDAIPGPRIDMAPRDGSYIVRIDGQVGQIDGDPFQIALPKALREELEGKFDGSLSQGLVALARFGLDYLDAAAQRLVIHHGMDPLLFSANTRPLAEDIRPTGRCSMYEIEHRRPKEPVVQLSGRVPRGNATHLLIKFPNDLKARLKAEGVGSLGQLLVYLARFGLWILDRGDPQMLKVVLPPAVTARSAFPPQDPANLRLDEVIAILRQLPQHAPMWHFVDHATGCRYRLVYRPEHDPQNPLGLQPY